MKAQLKIHKTFGKQAVKPPYEKGVLVWSLEWEEWALDNLQEGADGDYWFHSGTFLEPDVGSVTDSMDPMEYTHWIDLPESPVKRKKGKKT